nr:twin-arginine translocation signal domain-containing protein [Brucella tritici]
MSISRRNFIVTASAAGAAAETGSSKVKPRHR